MSLLLVLALLAVQDAPSQEPPPRNVMKDGGQYYPLEAVRQDIEGKVVLSCTVQPDGTVANCQVVEETPAGHGFGQAALKMSSRFRMRPQTSDGHPVGGAVVRIPIKFERPP